MLTNVVLVIPTLAILIIVAAYINVHSYATEAILIGLWGVIDVGWLPGVPPALGLTGLTKRQP